MNWITDFKQNAQLRLEENLPRIELCLNQLSEEEVWQKPVAAGNSMANLVLHLCGNITQYILSGVGHQPDNRVRSAEFSASGGPSKSELLEQLSRVVHEASQIIASAGEENLLTVRSVQGFQLSGMGMIIHAVEHFSYHTGQIALYTKMLRNTDLGFYKNMNLDITGTE